MAKNRNHPNHNLRGKPQTSPAQSTHTGKKDKLREAKGDSLDPIIAFLKPLREKNKIPKRLVNVVILIRSAFPGKSVKKSIVKRAYLKAGWDIDTLCTLTNNELANAIERGEVDASYDEAKQRVDAVEPRKPTQASNVTGMAKVYSQPATSQQGFPEGYFEASQPAGPKKKWSKAYPSMFYNDPLVSQAQRTKGQAQNASGHAPLAPLKSQQPSSNDSSKGDALQNYHLEKARRYLQSKGVTPNNQLSQPVNAIALAAKHNRYRDDRVRIRQTPLGVNSILKIVTELNNTHDMPKKFIRVRNLIRTEHPGVIVRKSMINKAYKRAGWNKKELKAVTKRNMKAPKERNDDPRPLRKRKVRSSKRVAFRENIPPKAMEPQVTEENLKPAAKPQRVFKAHGTMGRKHRVLHEIADASLEDRRKMEGVNKKVAVAMDRLQRRKH